MICSITQIFLTLSAVLAVSASHHDSNAKRFARGLPPLPPSQRSPRALRPRQSPNPIVSAASYYQGPQCSLEGESYASIVTNSFEECASFCANPNTVKINDSDVKDIMFQEASSSCFCATPRILYVEEECPTNNFDYYMYTGPAGGVVTRR